MLCYVASAMCVVWCAVVCCEDGREEAGTDGREEGPRAEGDSK